MIEVYSSIAVLRAKASRPGVSHSLNTYLPRGTILTNEIFKGYALKQDFRIPGYIHLLPRDLGERPDIAISYSLSDAVSATELLDTLEDLYAPLRAATHIELHDIPLTLTHKKVEVGSVMGIRHSSTLTYARIKILTRYIQHATNADTSKAIAARITKRRVKTCLGKIQEQDNYYAFTVL